MYRLWHEGKPPVVNPSGRRYWTKDPFYRLARSPSKFSTVLQDIDSKSDRVRFR